MRQGWVVVQGLVHHWRSVLLEVFSWVGNVVEEG